MRITVGDLASACGGVVTGSVDTVVDGAHYDSRELRPGQLFVPVIAEGDGRSSAGERRDGHDHVLAAIAAGAAAYLTSRGPIPGASVPAIEVADTVVALDQCARLGRSRLPDRVIGITGSVGKTSVKDLTAAALRPAWRVAANERSFNNELGLPVTVLSAPDRTEVTVLEMGMRGFGHIAALCATGRPTVGIVTAVAPAHTALVGGIEGVARAKAELVQALPPTGVAVLNASDERVIAMGALTAAQVLSFGLGVGDVRAERVTLDELGRPRFRLATPWGSADVALLVSGKHNAVNAAAAAAAALAVGSGLESIVAGLGTSGASAWRSEVGVARSGARIINDAYNANPASMTAGLELLAALPASRRIAVLGYMAELDDERAGHAAVAERVHQLGIELVAVGTDLYGVEPVAAADVPARLGPLGPAAAVLVKASRVAGLEGVAAVLLGL